MDKELKRLKRFIVVSWVLLLFVLIGITFYFSAQQRRTNQLLAVTQSKIVNPIYEQLPPEKGEKGDKGDKGDHGVDGTNAISTDSTVVVEQPLTTIVQQQVPVMGLQGPKGDKGDPGPPGREIQLGLQGDKTVWRYIGDELWQTLEEVNL